MFSRNRAAFERGHGLFHLAGSHLQTVAAKAVPIDSCIVERPRNGLQSGRRSCLGLVRHRLGNAGRTGKSRDRCRWSAVSPRPIPRASPARTGPPRSPNHPRSIPAPGGKGGRVIWPRRSVVHETSTPNDPQQAPPHRRIPTAGSESGGERRSGEWTTGHNCPLTTRERQGGSDSPLVLPVSTRVRHHSARRNGLPLPRSRAGDLTLLEVLDQPRQPPPTSRFRHRLFRGLGHFDRLCLRVEFDVLEKTVRRRIRFHRRFLR
ncbi:MAG: hypothetical protein Ct9H300mP1_18640 [Planctomycetaceae bacterium]|nr:MAG: hypothetical protein Ct9H300mP1_18640 [Planctomycetaceae bacterium]